MAGCISVCLQPNTSTSCHTTNTSSYNSHCTCVHTASALPSTSNVQLLLPDRSPPLGAANARVSKLTRPPPPDTRRTVTTARTAWPTCTARSSQSAVGTVPQRPPRATLSGMRSHFAAAFVHTRTHARALHTHQSRRLEGQGLRCVHRSWKRAANDGGEQGGYQDARQDGRREPCGCVVC